MSKGSKSDGGSRSEQRPGVNNPTQTSAPGSKPNQVNPNHSPPLGGPNSPSSPGSQPQGGNNPGQKR